MEEPTLHPGPTLGPQDQVWGTGDNASCPAWLIGGKGGGALSRLLGMVSWHFNEFLFPVDRNLIALEGNTVSLLLHTHILLPSNH